MHACANPFLTKLDHACKQNIEENACMPKFFLATCLSGYAVACAGRLACPNTGTPYPLESVGVPGNWYVYVCDGFSDGWSYREGVWVCWGPPHDGSPWIPFDPPHVQGPFLVFVLVSGGI